MNLSPPTQTTSRPAGTRLVPWLCLAAALCWGVLLRVPLVLNAPVHLDSDLAVDGLTLQEAVQGHWRWHYPGTPYMGTGAVLLSWFQARIWGANPMTLVSGGMVAHVLLTAAVFALAWRVFGRGVAMGGLLPLAFASTGVLWLSGRITGGHLLIVAWSAVAWLLVHEALVRGGWMRLMALGVWCGLGVYLDSMFLMTLAGVLISGLTGLMLMSRSRRSTAPGEADGSASQLWLSRVMGGLVLCLAFLAGAAPRAIGRWVEPYDAYNEQFSWSLDSRLLAEHARILLLECLPRLVAGHRLPGLEADPDPSLLGTGAPIQKSLASHGGFRWWTLLLSVLALGSFAAAMGSAGARGREPIRHRLAGHRGRHARLRGGHRSGLPGQPQHLQFGQLSIPGPAPGSLVDRAWAGAQEGEPAVHLRTRGGPGLRDRPGGSVHLRRSGVVSSIGLDRRSAHASPPPA